MYLQMMGAFLIDLGASLVNLFFFSEAQVSF